jgi:predicted negative regulator of RcsB-dependent stress response
LKVRSNDTWLPIRKARKSRSRSRPRVCRPFSLKPLLIGTGITAALVIGFFGYSGWRTNVLEKHEAAVAELIVEVQGDGVTPVPAAELEPRMRTGLTRLEALANAAPHEVASNTKGLLAAWRLQLDGKAPQTTTGSDPWARLRTAQRQLALGQAEDVTTTLKTLRNDAKPDAPWAPLFWATLLDLHRMKGDRDQAWKDYAEYKALFKDRADASFEKVLASI